MKSRNVMYEQQLAYLEGEKLIDVIKRHIESFDPKPTRYAGIIHNKDVNEVGEAIESHVHIIYQFENARSLRALAKQINEAEERFEAWKGNVNNGYSYLVHRTSDAVKKYQYEVDEVIANFDYQMLMEIIEHNVKDVATLSDTVIINYLLDRLYQGEITLKEAEDSLTGSQLAKASRRLDEINKKRMERNLLQWQKKMKDSGEPVLLIWIFGDSGTGKTRMAKDYAKSMDSNYYITGSTRDPFQHYNEENTVILDELRPRVFDYSDLLKMLDPYNERSVASSRYFDKPLQANKFIVTSPYSPKKFYEELVMSKRINKEVDSFLQLARRIDLVQRVSKKHVVMYQFSDEENDFVLDETTKMQNPYPSQYDDIKEEKHEKAYKLFDTVMTSAVSNNNYGGDVNESK